MKNKTQREFTKMNFKLEILSAREQLMHDIDCIVEGCFYDKWGDEYAEEQIELVNVLCDAVCRNFPFPEDTNKFLSK